MYKVDIYTDGSSLIKGDYYEASSAVLIIINDNEVWDIVYVILSLLTDGYKSR